MNLASWKQFTLSFAGRLELVKSVLSANHVYWTAAFQLPLSIIKQVELICRNFLWGGTAMDKKIHTRYWEQISKPLTEGTSNSQLLESKNQVP